MGKRLHCGECGCEIVFWGEVPKYHRCGKCGAKIKVSDEETTAVDINNKPVGSGRVRTRRPGARI